MVIVEQRIQCRRKRPIWDMKTSRCKPSNEAIRSILQLKPKCTVIRDIFSETRTVANLTVALLHICSFICLLSCIVTFKLANGSSLYSLPSETLYIYCTSHSSIRVNLVLSKVQKYFLLHEYPKHLQVETQF